MTERNDPDDIAPGEQARRLLRAAETGTLATLMPDGGGAESGPSAGWPYASLVLLAAAPDGAPLLLLSDLAQHTRNARADGRVSLSVAAMADGAAAADPLTRSRASLLGRLAPAVPADDGAGAAAGGLRARFLARHPSASDYAGFGDFNLWRLQVDRVHLVAGFGRIAWAPGAAYAFGGDTAALAAAEPDILAHMNADHREAVALYATRLCGQAAGDWQICGCDPEGIDLRSSDGRRCRLDFDRPIADAGAARRALVDLVGRARAIPGA